MIKPTKNNQMKLFFIVRFKNPSTRYPELAAPLLGESVLEPGKDGAMKGYFRVCPITDAVKNQPFSTFWHIPSTVEVGKQVRHVGMSA